MKIIAFKRKTELPTKRNYYRGPMFAAPGEIGPAFAYCGFEEKYKLEADYAIIDLETSGLNSASSRILEIAIMIIDKNGTITESFETLINPGDGEVGRADIHQITPQMLKNAPYFSDVASKIKSLLHGKIVVAHNAKFEEKFLSSEYLRTGIKLGPIPAIDTMWLAQMELDLDNYKLHTVAKHFGIQIENAHTAFGDISAMQKFFPRMIQMNSEISFPIILNEAIDHDGNFSLAVRGQR